MKYQMPCFSRADFKFQPLFRNADNGTLNALFKRKNIFKIKSSGIQQNHFVE